MTRTHASVIAFAFSSLFAAQAMAHNGDTSVTREHVKAELAEAIRTGNIVTGESGVKLNETVARNYASQSNVASADVTRAQVQAELAEAIRTGNIMAGESGLTLKEAHPHSYPA